MKWNGLAESGVPPNGYKYIGFDNNTFSSKSDDESEIVGEIDSVSELLGALFNGMASQPELSNTLSCIYRKIIQSENPLAICGGSSLIEGVARQPEFLGNLTIIFNDATGENFDFSNPCDGGTGPINQLPTLICDDRGRLLRTLLMSIARQPELSNTLSCIYTKLIDSNNILAIRSGVKLLESIARQPEFSGTMLYMLNMATGLNIDFSDCIGEE